MPSEITFTITRPITFWELPGVAIEHSKNYSSWVGGSCKKILNSVTDDKDYLLLQLYRVWRC